MNLIHETSGRARDYSPLALRIYTNCDLSCSCCQHRTDDEPVTPGDVRPVKDFRQRLRAELAHRPITRQVLVGYPGDPYCHAEIRLHGHTRFALERLHEHQVPVAILTKMGTMALRDLNLFTTMYCKVGAVLAFENPAESLTGEPGGALPSDRIAMLERLKESGVRTWASLEVTDPAQMLALIDRTHTFVDEYRVSMPIHIRRAYNIDRRRFAGDVVDKLREYGKAFHVAKSLQCFAYGLTDAETDPDHLTLAMETADCA